MVLSAGALRKFRLEVLRKVETQGPTGASARTWAATGRRVAAEVRPVSGRERILADGGISTVSYTIRLRLSDGRGIDEADRLRDQHGRVYHVLSVQHDDLARESLILATEIRE